MPRCLSRRATATRAVFAAAHMLALTSALTSAFVSTLPLSAAVVGSAAAVLAAMPLTAQAQAARPVPIPPQSLRGEAVFGLPPELKLNDQVARLSPASRIRGQSNTLLMSGTLSGQTWTVNYTLDPYTGQVQDIWLLTPEEAARRWPKTREEATTWSFDPISQSWAKP